MHLCHTVLSTHPQAPPQRPPTHLVELKVAVCEELVLDQPPELVDVEANPLRLYKKLTPPLKGLHQPAVLLP